MKKRTAMILAAAITGATAFTTVANAAPEGEITVVSREDGSGTRGAFVELLGIEEKIDDQKVDMTTLEASITNSTSVMMTTVAGDENAIGYISLGSLNETVKALDVDGVEATAENIEAGEYAVARPFNIVTGGELSDAAADFINYIMSAEGQQIVEDNGYIKVAAEAAGYEATEAEGKVVVAGSSSVAPVMEKIKEAYEAVNENVEIEVQVSDSTTGVNFAIEGSCDIGMASRELKEAEIENGAVPTVIAQDGIAVVVNNENDIDGLTSEQIRAIFVGEYLDWEEVA